jgi:hypothetical protein
MSVMHHKVLTGAVAVGVVVGAGAVAGAAVGAGPFAPSDEGSGTTSSTLPDDQPGADLPIGSTQTFAVGDAGFVTAMRDDTGLHVVSTTATDGWTAQLSDDSGRELRVTFTRTDGQQVALKLELEHGGVQVELEHELGDDRGGAVAPGVDNRGPGSVNSGPGSLSSGPDGTTASTGAPAPTTPVSPPPTVDDHGGSSGSGGHGGSGGLDDGSGHDSGDDHGGSSGSGSGSGSSGSGGRGPG